MTPAKKNFKIKANGHWTNVWQISNNGEPLNLSGYSFELEVKKNRGATSAKFLNLTVGSGITIADPSTGRIQIDISPQPSITTSTTFEYDLIAIKDGKPYVWIEGQMVFEPGVSYMGV